MLITIALIACLIAIAAAAVVLYLLLLDNRLIRNEMRMMNDHLVLLEKNYRDVAFEKLGNLSNDITRIKMRTDRIARIIGFPWKEGE